MTSLLSYHSRSSLSTSPVAKKLLRLMERKGSNLCVGIDRTTSKEILDLAEILGPEICLLKTHVDIISDFSQDFILSLRQIADRHKFLLFEDRKFADIGNTTKLQYTSGVHRIADWADITNAHPLPGPGVVEALREGAKDEERGILLIAQMSSDKNLITDSYSQACIQIAKSYTDCVIGYICQERIDQSPGTLHMVPGVRFAKEGDSLGQRYTSPKDAIAKGADIIIVGRGITEASNPLQEAQLYRDAAWKAYENLTNETFCTPL